MLYFPATFAPTQLRFMTIKRLLAAASFLALLSSANAQFNKGDKMAGASIGNIIAGRGVQESTVTSVGSTTGQVRSFEFNFSPSFGWFLSEKTAAGFSLILNPAYQKVSFEENGSTFQRDNVSTFNIGIGGFARNYFSAEGNFLPFGEFSFNAGINSRNTDGFFYGGSGPSAFKRTYDGKSSGGFFTNASFLAGVTRMVGEYTGLDIFLGYKFSYSKGTAKTTTLTDLGNDGSTDETAVNETSTKFTNHGFMIGVGFQVFIKEKGKQ